MPWLKRKLEGLSWQVFVPSFPTPEGQELSRWLEIFKEYEESLDKNTIMVGYSLGVAFILRILEKTKSPIKAAFFVAGFVGSLGNPVFDKINKTFLEAPFDWQKIRKNCEKFFVFHSDNDPYVSLKQGGVIARNLGTNLILVKNAGHFNEKAGYKKFELLLEKIKEI